MLTIGVVMFFLKRLSLIIFLSCTSLLFSEPNEGEQLLSRTKLVREKIEVPRFCPKENIFLQANTGIGFLFFSGVKGQLSGAPNAQYIFWNPVNLNRSRPQYNSTPAFEYILGYNFFSWLKFGVSYQHQGGITINTPINHGHSSTKKSPNSQLISNLSLDGALAKVYFQLPIHLKRAFLMPYIAGTVGIGWQSWTRTVVNRGYETVIDSEVRAYDQSLRQKVSGNFIWGTDLGLMIRSSLETSPLALTVGCRYTGWGQARNIGKIDQQDNNNRQGLLFPFHIKSITQVAPYLGLEWDFASTSSSRAPYSYSKGSSNTWRSFFVNSKEVQNRNSFFTSANIGVGFLYFSHIRGALTGTPTLPLRRSGIVPLNRTHLQYNRTPLYEYLMGVRLFNMTKVALSYQHQGGVTIQTPKNKGTPQNIVNNTTRDGAFSQLSADVTLDALMLKFYFNSPIYLVLKNVIYSPYLGAGVGPSWQNWNRISVGRESLVTTDSLTLRINTQVLRQKTSVNLAWSADVGIRFANAGFNKSYMLQIGMKYNQWGQVRNIGQLNQQDNNDRMGLIHAFRIRTVYQFAPYLGFQWNFYESFKPTSPRVVKGRAVNTWTPYWAKAATLCDKYRFFFQGNIGVGLLYFSGVKGSLTGVPNFQGGTEMGYRIFNPTPLTRSRLQYNRTPLYEGLLGIKFANWFKVAISYQHQGEVALSTPRNHSFNAKEHSPYSQLISYLSLDGVSLKTYFELPFTSIWKGLAMTPYLGLSGGVGWQTWRRMEVNRTFESRVGRPDFRGFPQTLRLKVCANAIWGADFGIRTQSAYPNSLFAVTMGCKYNQWGQARNIGKITQQDDNLRRGLQPPFKIKVIYQFAPYLGVQWNF